MTGVYVDESLYRAVEIVPNLVNGPFMVLNMDDGEPQEDVLVIRIGFLMREKVLESWYRNLGQHALELLADGTKMEILLYIRIRRIMGKK